MMKIAILGNSYQQAALAHINRLLQALASQGVELVIERHFGHYLKSQLPGLPAMRECQRGGESMDAQVIVSIGGDGTFLRAAQAVAGFGTPIMGVNSGHLGYLTTADVKDTLVIVDALLHSNYRVERRSMLELDYDGEVHVSNPYALNEIAILRQETSSMIDVTVDIGDHLLTTYKGDGLLVCTPTGSTAYNLSVGGPILDPMSQCLALSPISPHALTMRPIVVRDDTQLTITTRSRAPLYQVSIDGESLILPSGTTVKIRRAPFTTGVIQLHGTNFAHTLRSKLMWGKDNR